MMLDYKQTRLFYSSKGTGNPLILLHGFLETSEIWDRFVPKLSEKRQVVCIDLPGHGDSGNVDEVHSMELMADAVKAVMDHLNVKKAGLAGHSMGGYVALAFCEKFPEMTESLSLINSTPEADSEERKENRERGIELVKKNKRSFVSMAISNLLIPEDSVRLRPQLEEISKRALNFSEKGIIAAMKGMKIRTDRTSVLKGFNHYKMIVAGQHDPVLDFTDIKDVASKCECKFHSFSGGHLSYLEHPEDLIAIMHFID